MSSIAGSTPIATVMSCTSCDDRISPDSTSHVFRILPRSGITAWNSRSRACLAEPPAESPSTRKSSVRFGSWLRAVGELARQRGPADHALARDLLARLEAGLRVADRELRDPLARLRVLVQPEPELVLDDAGDERRRLARGQPLLGLARELRIAHLGREHVARVVPDVLGRELEAARQQVAELAELADGLGEAEAEAVDVRAALHASGSG